MAGVLDVLMASMMDVLESAADDESTEVEDGGVEDTDALSVSDRPLDDKTVTLEVLCSTELREKLECERDNAADVVEDLEGEGDSDGDGDGK